MKRLFAIAPFLFLAACDVAPPTAPTPGAPTIPSLADDTCRAGDYANLIGQDVTALERVMILGQVRIIRPGQAVTMDFRPNRINFHIGTDNRIRSINCS